ncbi:MAG TPA: hypothetical protein VFV52_03875 [Bacilli bacterium]|nr:hypothetical protein [Bacilli bacterium]
MRKYILVLLLVALTATFLVLSYLKKSNEPQEDAAERKAASKLAVQFARQLLSYDDWTDSTHVRGLELAETRMQNFLQRDHRYLYEWMAYEYGEEYLPHVDDVEVTEVYPVLLPEKKPRHVYVVNLVVHYSPLGLENEDYMEPGLMVTQEPDGRWKVAALSPYNHFFPAEE